ncbi:MAG: FecR domain-containing protein [Candidatus Omnitrophota bacterium]
MRSKAIIISFIFMMSALCAQAGFSQSQGKTTAKIIDVKGDVSVKKATAGAWEKATTNMFLDPQAEIKTGADSKCTLIFDDAMKNILTVKEDSQITLTQTKPVDIALAQGKVFALIDDITRVEKFEIRTPTAVCGVRGTGETVEYANGSTIAQCLLDVVNVQGLDANGILQKALELLAGQGVTIGPEGLLSAPFEISEADRRAWEGFLSYIEYLRSIEESNKTPEDTFLGDQQAGYRDSLIEDERRNAREETPPQDEGQPSPNE